MDESCQCCNVSRVEDNNNVLNVWAVLLDILTEVSCDLAVTLQQVLTCHTFLTWSTTRRDDVLSTSECLSRINGVREVSTRESTLLHLVKYTMNAWLIDIVQTDVRSETECENGLNHVRTNHTASTDDNEFFVC